MGAFNLDKVQANHIPDVQLRHLIKYSTLELNAKADELVARIDKLQRILDDDTVLNALVFSELDETVERFGTSHRAVLLAADDVVRSAAPLEVPDEPCWVLLSITGYTVRTDSAASLPVMGPRAAHGVIVAAIKVTSRTELGVITNTGRPPWVRAIELPTVPLTVTAPNLQGGSESRELWPLKQGERVVGLTFPDPGGLGLALGTLRDVVKRVNSRVVGKGSWDVIRLEKGDEVVDMVELESSSLAFITSDVQLLHFSTDLVRPQGRLGGGVTGMKPSRDVKVLFFGGMDPTTDLVVTVAGASDSLLGHTTADAKVIPLAEYPTKGRAAGRTRYQRLLERGAALIVAAIGRFVTVAVLDGMPVVLSEPTPERNGSGVPLKGVVEALGARRTPEVVELIP